MEQIITQKPSLLDVQLQEFNPVNLEEMNKAAFMKRTDQKFLLNEQQLEKLIPQLSKHYSVLEVNGSLNHSYTSVYYDTHNLDMYHNHHNTKANRYKIRQRMYNSSGDSFIEIKHKNNKGYTNKLRLETEKQFSKNIPYQYFNFIRQNSVYHPLGLQKVLESDFKRFTLTNALRSQRITIDTQLSFWLKNKPYLVDNLVIAEVKSDRENLDRTIFNLFRQNGIRSSGMSKYSIGLAMLRPDLKQNLFKQKIHNLNTVRHAN